MPRRVVPHKKRLLGMLPSSVASELERNQRARENFFKILRGVLERGKASETWLKRAANEAAKVALLKHIEVPKASKVSALMEAEREYVERLDPLNRKLFEKVPYEYKTRLANETKVKFVVKISEELFAPAVDGPIARVCLQPLDKKLNLKLIHGANDYVTDTLGSAAWFAMKFHKVGNKTLLIIWTLQPRMKNLKASERKLFAGWEEAAIKYAESIAKNVNASGVAVITPEFVEFMKIERLYGNETKNRVRDYYKKIENMLRKKGYERMNLENAKERLLRMAPFLVKEV